MITKHTSQKVNNAESQLIGDRCGMEVHRGGNLTLTRLSYFLTSIS